MKGTKVEQESRDKEAKIFSLTVDLKEAYKKITALECKVNTQVSFLLPPIFQ